MTDTKLRMSINQKIIDTLDNLAVSMRKATEHTSNAYRVRQIELPCKDDTKDIIRFDFNGNGWEVTRFSGREGVWMKQNKDGWQITCDDIKDEMIRISTFGKMCVDINREIEPLLEQVAIQVGLIENPVYCPVCDHCGETGCCGFIGFLEKHVRGKTDCIYEDQILDDLEKWIKEEDD